MRHPVKPKQRRPATGDAPILKLVPPDPPDPTPGGAPQRARIEIVEAPEASESGRRLVQSIREALSELALARQERVRERAQAEAHRSGPPTQNDAHRLLEEWWREGAEAIWWEGADGAELLRHGREAEAPEAFWPIDSPYALAQAGRWLKLQQARASRALPALREAA